MHTRRGDGTMPSPPPTTSVGGTPPPSPAAMLMLIFLAVLTMGFSIGMWLLGDVTLAATAGTGALALVVDIARRLLTTGVPNAPFTSHTRPQEEISPPPTSTRTTGSESTAPTTTGQP